MNRFIACAVGLPLVLLGNYYLDFYVSLVFAVLTGTILGMFAAWMDGAR